ncbi:MAG: ABC transporter ATP-binding protein, partial [Clostridia bacterium]|nr:ABC transporter ATP-binding protein [Clostridia bacterium]
MAGEKKNSNYLTGREIRAIAKANKKEIQRLEAYKNRKAPESEFITRMKNPDNILEIENLHTYFFTEQGVVKAVGGVSYDVPKHSVVGVVGESGCGKSVTSMSVMRLIQGPAGQIVDGSIRFQSYDYKKDEKGNPIKNEDGSLAMEEKIYDIAKMPINEIHRVRGKQIAMIFQEPMTSLNPVFTIGQQLDEVIFIHDPKATK